MTEAVPKNNRAWAILIGCCCCAAAGMGLTISLIGVYMVPASQGMGLSIPEFTMWSSALGIVQLFSFPVWGQLMKKNFKMCYLVGVILEVIGIFLFSVLNTLLGMIAIGIILGIALPMTFFMPIPTLTNNWFAAKHRGKMMGIAMAFSGVGTFIWAPLFTAIIGAVGYQTCYQINAVLALILLLPWVFVFKFTPEEVGLKPWGWTPEDDLINEKSEGANQAGMSAKKALATPAFWCMIIAIAMCAIGMGYSNCQRPMAAEMLGGIEDSAMIGATMISTAAVGNVLGKIVYGVIADKAGLKIATIIFQILDLLCFVLWFALPGQLIAMYIGAFCLGTNNGMAQVGLPRIARTLFGGAAYEKIWSRLSMASAIIGGWSNTIISSLAAGVGTYVGIQFLGIGIVFAIVCFIFAMIAIGFIGKLKWDIGTKEEEA